MVGSKSDNSYMNLMIVNLLVMIGLGILIHKVDQNKSNWVAGMALFIADFVFIGIQAILLSFMWVTNSKIKLILVILSCVMMLALIIGFIHYNLTVT